MGPAVESAEKVKQLIDAGMNMARLNLSHGSYEEHQGRLDRVRAAAKEAGVPVAILVDLQGPKIRLARLFSQLQPMMLKVLKSALELRTKVYREIAKPEIAFLSMTAK